MEENEFIPVDHTKTKKRTTKKSSSTKKSSKSKKSKSFMSKIDLNKIATIIGSFLLMFSIFLFIACLSYLFTWQEDQDKLVNNSFIDFILINLKLKSIINSGNLVLGCRTYYFFTSLVLPLWVFASLCFYWALRSFSKKHWFIRVKHFQRLLHLCYGAPFFLLFSQMKFTF